MGANNGKYVRTARLDGKTAVITGCNTGIGKVTVKEFYKIGARVIMACRDRDRAEAAMNEIKETVQPVGDASLGELVVVELDLASFASIRKCAQKILDTESRLDLLVNNAGIMLCPQGKTEDGFELQFGVNYVGHFLFTCLLLPLIIQSAPARIINVSSLAHRGGKINFNDLNGDDSNYSSLRAYQNSKLANILFSKELNTRLKDKGITGVNTYSLHPGIVRTELGRNVDDTYFKGLRWFISFFHIFFKTPEEGAQTTLHCALDEAAGQESGLYYSDCKVIEPMKDAKDAESAKILWDKTMTLAGIENLDIFTGTDK